MRSERLNFLQGRTPFEGYVYDGVLAAADSGLVRIDDETAFEAPADPVDGKTLENFINKSSTIFEVDRTSGYQNIKTANTTLRYMHAFLWSRHPERVERWEKESGKLFDDLIVENLDDSFRVFESQKTFPHGVKLVATEKADVSVLSLLVQEAYQNRDRSDFDDFEQAVSPLLAVAAFAPIKGDVLNRAVILTPRQWDYIKRFNEELSDGTGQDSFDPELIPYRGVSISFQSRDYSLGSGPAITQDQSVTVLKLRRKQRGRTEYSHLRIKELEPLSPFDNKDGGTILVAAVQTELFFEDKAHKCLPIHLSTEEERLISEIFEFIA